MSGGYVLVMDSAVVRAAEMIACEMAKQSAPTLGLEWRIVIERDGSPAAAVVRTRDEGIKMHFYGDEEGDTKA